MATASPATDSTCLICNKEFKNAKGLNIHISRMHKGFTNQCKPQEMNKGVSPREKEKEDSTEGDSTCLICNKEFKNANGLKIHTSRMHKGFTNQCKPQEMNKDVSPREKEEEDSTEGDSTCLICNKEFKKANGLKIHTSRMHKGFTNQCKPQEMNKDVSPREKEEEDSTEGDSTCLICNKEFKNANGLKIHTSRMHNGFTNQCKPQEMNKDVSPREKEEEDSTEGDSTCLICNKEFKNANGLKIHTSRMHKGFTNQCKPQEMNKDVPPREKEEEDSTEGDSTCLICNKEFKNANGLKIHTSRMHNGFTNQCKPQEMNKDVSPREKEEEDSTEGDSTCLICNKEFKNANGLKIHTSRMHKGFTNQCKPQEMNKDVSPREEEKDDSTEGDSTCLICNKEFRNAKGLKIHTSRMHKGFTNQCKPQEMNKDVSPREKEEEDSTEGDSTCLICNKEFKNANGLKIHTSRMHKEFTNQCKPQEMNKDVLPREKEEEDSTEGDSTCLICNKEFKNANGLKIHTSRMHKGFTNQCKPQEMNKDVSPREKEEEDSTEGDSTCLICNKEFKNANGLKIHTSRTHKGFTNQCKPQEMNKDVSPREKEEEVSTEGDSTCLICNKEFKNANGLKIHTSRMHKGFTNQCKPQEMNKDVSPCEKEEEDSTEGDSSSAIYKREFNNAHGLNVHISREHKGVKECKDLGPCKKEEEVRTEGEQITSRVHKEDKHQIRLLGKNNDVSRKKEEEKSTEGESLIGRYLMTSSTIPGKPKITIQDLEREIKTKKEDTSNVAKVVKDLKQSLEMFLCHNSVEFNIMNSGSYYDLTKIQRPDEFDFMFCTKFVGTPVLDGPPGYCRIRIEGRNRDQIKDGLMTQNGFLCPQKFKQYVFDMFEEQLSRSDFHKARKLKRKDRDKDSPAYTVEYIAIPGHPIDIDLVPSVTLSGWPGETIQKPSWLVKPIDEKKLSEHHAVAKTCTEDIPNAKSLWRVSFSGAESALMKAANDGNYESSRKFVFKVLKLILTKAKEKSETMKRFCSYHLKMFMFEQFEKWEKGEDGKFFRRKQLLKTLSELHKRLQQNPAIIWNYFNKDDNIIRHVSREELNEVIKALDKAFRDIIENDDKTLFI